MEAMRWLVLHDTGLVDGQTMMDFRASDSDQQGHIANCSSTELEHPTTKCKWKLTLHRKC